MIRKIIQIDEEKCNGCGLCAKACHEHAIGIVSGKARLLRDDYCDGLGDCLPACPTGAITFVEREAAPYDAAAVQANRHQWPVQLKLTSVAAPYFHNAHLLLAADCTAYAYPDFHTDFMSGKTVLIGCTKLDAVDYSEKLAEIFRNNQIQSVTVARMEVPCCRGMEAAALTALKKSGKKIPFSTVVISTEGSVI